MNKSKSFFGVLEKLCTLLLILLLSIMIICVFAQVASRYLMHTPFSWTEEIARYLMIWSAFIGAALAYRKNAHLGVDILVKKLPNILKKVIIIVVNLGTIGFSSLLCVMGFEFVQKTMNQYSGAMRIQMGYIYLAIPVGALLMLLFSIEKIYEAIKSKDLTKEKDLLV